MRKQKQYLSPISFPLKWMTKKSKTEIKEYSIFYCDWFFEKTELFRDNHPLTHPQKPV